MHHAIQLGQDHIQLALTDPPPHSDPVAHAVMRLRTAAGACSDFARKEPGYFATAFPRTSAGHRGDAEFSRGPTDTMLGSLLDDLVKVGYLPPEFRPTAEHAAWAAMHGLSALLVAGPLRRPGPAAQEAAIDRTSGLVAFRGRGRLTMRSVDAPAAPLPCPLSACDGKDGLSAQLCISGEATVRPLLL